MVSDHVKLHRRNVKRRIARLKLVAPPCESAHISVVQSIWVKSTVSDPIRLVPNNYAIARELENEGDQSSLLRIPHSYAIDWN